MSDYKETDEPQGGSNILNTLEAGLFNYLRMGDANDAREGRKVNFIPLLRQGVEGGTMRGKLGGGEDKKKGK